MNPTSVALSREHCIMFAAEYRYMKVPVVVVVVVAENFCSLFHRVTCLINSVRLKLRQQVCGTSSCPGSQTQGAGMVPA